jgi:RHS repeat-associated protein
MDAAGAKLRKTVKRSTGVVKETWDYVNGVEYKDRLLQRVAHDEGAIVRNAQGVYEQEYVLRDHLGNTRVTFTDSNNDGIVTSADIKQLNHYYPFGLNMEGNWNGAPGTNKYQYNGKELNDDFGLGWNDYGARFYDPSIARWSAIDPLAEARNTLSAYQYVQNNPIKHIDPTGMIDESFFAGGATGKTMAEKSAEFQEKAIAGHDKEAKAKSNVYVVLSPNQSERDRINDNRDAAETWNTYAVASLDEAEVMLQKYGNNKIDNLVIETHGACDLKAKRTYMISTESTDSYKRKELDKKGVKQSPLASIFQRVKAGGNIAFVTCGLGMTDAGNQMGITLSSMNPSANIYLNVNASASATWGMYGKLEFNKRIDYGNASWKRFSSGALRASNIRGITILDVSGTSALRISQ